MWLLVIPQWLPLAFRKNTQLLGLVNRTFYELSLFSSWSQDSHCSQYISQMTLRSSHVPCDFSTCYFLHLNMTPGSDVTLQGNLLWPLESEIGFLLCVWIVLSLDILHFRWKMPACHLGRLILCVKLARPNSSLNIAVKVYFRQN